MGPLASAWAPAKDRGLERKSIGGRREEEGGGKRREEEEKAGSSGLLSLEHRLCISLA